MFGRKNEINPYAITDTVVFRNLEKTLTLFVRSDASTIVIRLKAAHDKLAKMTDDTPDNERSEAAFQFAASMFGEDQARDLCEFYCGDTLAIINACGMYFQQRLGKIITKAQKK